MTGPTAVATRLPLTGRLTAHNTSGRVPAATSRGLLAKVLTTASADETAAALLIQASGIDYQPLDAGQPVTIEDIGMEDTWNVMYVRLTNGRKFWVLVCNVG